MRSVLLVEDDPAVLGFLEKAFRKEGYEVRGGALGREALQAFSRNSADLVILDLNLPDMSGMRVLERLLLVDPDAAVIMLTGEADLATAVDAMRAGAENFLPKPVDTGHLFVAVERAFEKIELRRRAHYLEAREHLDGPDQSLGTSRALRELDEKLRLVAPTDATVLILGETGTGKSRAARLIHQASRRARGPFVEVNCAALSPMFLSSELFGHEKGAFTDAKTMKRGLLEVADRGTLFLDEIGDLAPELQPKLLHVLETRRFRRLGGTRDIQTDVRLIAATNRDLRQAVEADEFREDLYYRIAVMSFELPPLRERDPGDIAELARHMLAMIPRIATGGQKRITPTALQLLVRYPWPGNVREMRNVLERALILAGEAPAIEPRHLPAEIAVPGSAVPLDADADLGLSEVKLTLADVERRHIERVVAFCEGNRTRAAAILGISRVGLYKKLKRFEEGRQP